MQLFSQIILWLGIEFYFKIFLSHKCFKCVISSLYSPAISKMGLWIKQQQVVSAIMFWNVKTLWGYPGSIK